MTHQIAYRGDTGLFLASGPPYGNPEALSTTKNCKVNMKIATTPYRRHSAFLFNYRII